MAVLALMALAPSAVAAPTISATCSRTSGAAPFGVVCDASATTSADTTKPFHDLYYEWNFGDPGS